MIKNYLKSGMFISLCIFSWIVVAGENETYPVVNSNNVLSSEYLSSTYHRVDSVNINNDYYHFVVESDIGRYDIHSLALLKKRVNEIKTISRAINTYEQQDDELSGELRSQLTLSSDSAMSLLTSPLDSASNLAGQLAGNLNATLDGEDPFVYQSSSRLAYEPKDATTATHKRNIAFQLGLDMYTSNTRVQSFLNTIANARSSGRASAGVGLSNALAKSSDVDGMDFKIKYLIKNRTLVQLKHHNSEWLARMGVNELLINNFIEHPVLTPTNKTVITAYLSKLKNVSRLDKFIELVLTANNEVMSLIYERLSKALLQYQDKTEHFSAFYNFNGQAAVITDSRRIVFFDTADLLIWSEEKQIKYEKSANHAEKSGYKGWEIVSFGDISRLASQKISELAFKHTVKLSE
ncbi:MAG TPA: hypothetical protein EYQ42_10375 [Thiotrichaceae bacterium]|jgi:hypothetical protein|nr:hypothetical protein [Thiotrichaceae bacterium]HIM08369.1 hypothetical protein [Gammaproteobacteria bacterium]